MRIFSLLWFKDKVCEYLKSVWLAFVFQAKIFRVKSTESERITSSPGSSFHLFIFKIILFVVVVVGKYFFFNFILFFNFTILYWFCHISKWIRHRYTCVPHPEPSSLLPPHTIPLSPPIAPAPSIQYHASNLDWRFVSYLFLYGCVGPLLLHGLSLVAANWGYSPVAVCRLLTTATSLVVEHGL